MLPIVWREKLFFTDMWRENLFNRPSKTKSCEVHHFYSPIQIDIRLQVRIDLGLLRHKSIIQSPLAEREGWKAATARGVAGRRRRTGERWLCVQRRREKRRGRGRKAAGRLLASPTPLPAPPACPPAVLYSFGHPSSPSPCTTARLTSEVTLFLPRSHLLSSSDLLVGTSRHGRGM